MLVDQVGLAQSADLLAVVGEQVAYGHLTNKNRVL
jgi:hypothetical protein